MGVGAKCARFSLVWVMTGRFARGIMEVRTRTGKSYRCRVGASRLRQASGHSQTGLFPRHAGPDRIGPYRRSHLLVLSGPAAADDPPGPSPGGRPPEGITPTAGSAPYEAHDRNTTATFPSEAASASQCGAATTRTAATGQRLVAALEDVEGARPQPLPGTHPKSRHPRPDEPRRGRDQGFSRRCSRLRSIDTYRPERCCTHRRCRFRRPHRHFLRCGRW
jgi:hypothetical protein